MSKQGGTVLVLGDSTTWTNASKGSDLYAHRTWDAINKVFAPVKFVNKGYGGARSSDLINLVNHLALGVPYDLVIIGVGMNNATSTASETNLTNFKLNLEALITKLKGQRDCEIVLCTIPPTNDPNRVDKVAAYNAKIQEVVISKATKVADFSNAYTDFATYAPDGVHPNSGGHKLLYDILWPVVQTTSFVSKIKRA